MPVMLAKDQILEKETRQEGFLAQPLDSSLKKAPENPEEAAILASDTEEMDTQS